MARFPGGSQANSRQICCNPSSQRCCCHIGRRKSGTFPEPLSAECRKVIEANYYTERFNLYGNILGEIGKGKKQFACLGRNVVGLDDAAGASGFVKLYGIKSVIQTAKSDTDTGENS